MLKRPVSCSKVSRQGRESRPFVMDDALGGILVVGKGSGSVG
jgi:hypothetical protein